MNYQKVIQLLQPQLLQSGAVLHTDFAVAPLVYFDAIYLESVFTNLIGNAIKYSAIERTLQLTIASKYVDGAVQLAFCDNGIGMDMQVEKIRYSAYTSGFIPMKTAKV